MDLSNLGGRECNVHITVNHANQIQSLAENTPWSHFKDAVHGILNLELRAFWDGRCLPVMHQHELYTYPKSTLLGVQFCIKSIGSFWHSVLFFNLTQKFSFLWEKWAFLSFPFPSFTGHIRN